MRFESTIDIVSPSIWPVIETDANSISRYEKDTLVANSGHAIGKLVELGLFDGVNYQPRMKIVPVPAWQISTGLSDTWVEKNPTRALMCCREDETGFHILTAMKDRGRFSLKELTDDDIREWGHEWTHPYQNTQMAQGCGTNLFALNRGFIAEALCEVIQRDLVGHGHPVDLTNGVIPISAIREKGFFAIDLNGLGKNKAYYSAYLWLRKLLTGDYYKAPNTETVREFLIFISQHGTTVEELDLSIESKYPGYIKSIS